MKTVTFYAKGNRSGNLLHIETDGAVVNIHVGLVNHDGHRVTRVDVIPDNEFRGGDGCGNFWDIVPGDAAGVARVVCYKDAEHLDGVPPTGDGDGQQ